MAGNDLVELFRVLDFTQLSLYTAAVAIVGSPLLWTRAIEYEKKTQRLSAAVGSHLDACYLLAAVMFVTGAVRDACIISAIAQQPVSDVMDSSFVYCASVVLLMCGTTLYVTAFSKLGIIGTYFGDCFGFRLKYRITSFPYDTLDHPMYVGSAMISLGHALWHRSWAGVLLACLTWQTYRRLMASELAHTNAVYGSQYVPVSPSLRVHLRSTVSKAATAAHSRPSSPDGSQDSAVDVIGRVSYHAQWVLSAALQFVNKSTIWTLNTTGLQGRFSPPMSPSSPLTPIRHAHDD